MDDHTMLGLNITFPSFIILALQRKILKFQRPFLSPLRFCIMNTRLSILVGNHVDLEFSIEH